MVEEPVLERFSSAAASKLPCGCRATGLAAMPAARFRAVPMSRAQSNIANSVCLRDFRHEHGASQWTLQKKQALVKEINREFLKRNLTPIYNVEKLDMWTGNSLYRWRVKRRNARPKSWETKKRAPRQALAGKDDNQPPEPRTPIGCQGKTAAPAATLAFASLQPSTHASTGAQTPEPSALVVVASSSQANEPGVETPQPASMLPNQPGRRAQVPLVRQSSAASGDDWWLPYRPGRSCAVTPELRTVSIAAGSCRASGNREPAHVPASPGPVCRVTRPLSTLLELRASWDGKAANSREAVGWLR